MIVIIGRFSSKSDLRRVDDVMEYTIVVFLLINHQVMIV